MFVVPGHTSISPPLWTYGNISTRRSETEKWFFSAVCHRWWESLCNANIISHCVGLALQFALCTKQPGCGVIYPVWREKDLPRFTVKRLRGWRVLPLGLLWLGLPWLYWFRGASSAAFLLINSVSEHLSLCVSLGKRILLRGYRKHIGGYYSEVKKKELLASYGIHIHTNVFILLWKAGVCSKAAPDYLMLGLLRPLLCHLPTPRPMVGHFLRLEPMTLRLLPWKRVSCQRGGDRDIDVFLSLRHVTLLSIRFPALIPGIWITRGSVSYPCWEKKGDLVYLKEHAGLRGLFPQRGGYESECHSDSTHSHTASASACCQGAPALTSSPLLPFLSFIV